MPTPTPQCPLRPPSSLDERPPQRSNNDNGGGSRCSVSSPRYVFFLVFFLLTFLCFTNVYLHVDNADAASHLPPFLYHYQKTQTGYNAHEKQPPPTKTTTMSSPPSLPIKTTTTATTTSHQPTAAPIKGAQTTKRRFVVCPQICFHFIYFSFALLLLMSIYK
jgi:hypothetical protein